VDLKMEGADVRAWVTTEERVDPPKEEREGKASARGRVELVTFQSLGAGLDFDSGSVGSIGGDTHITDKEWKELAKDIHKPLGCDDILTLGEFLKQHGAIPPYENAALGTPPIPPGGERKTTSYHYQCGGSGAIDLNYPSGIEKSVIDEVRPHVIKLGFHTLWQVDNHFDHMHIDYAGVPSLLGGPTGAAGTLADSFLQVKLIDWDAPSPVGLGAGFVGGPGGIPFGPPDPRVASAMCQVLDQTHVSDKVRLAAWEAAIVESGVKALTWGDRDSQGPFQQRPSQGWGSVEQVRDPYYATRKFVTVAKSLERYYSDPGVLAQKVQRSGHPERYSQRAGQAAALDAKFCG
jgi:hypothetical protein